MRRSVCPCDSYCLRYHKYVHDLQNQLSVFVVKSYD
nr:MAG TPA: hypothetical protein [Caudoviricetes sp.]